MTPTPRPSPDLTRETDPAVRFDAVGLRYGRGPEILSDLSFDLPSGSFHFLTGPSGAGKSSLLRLIYRDRQPSRGLISLFGRDTALMPREDLPGLRRRIGVVFQDFRLLGHLSVFDNVALPLRVAGQARASYADDVADLLAWVGLGERLHALPASLSGGEQQRAAIARAVISRPDLLIADEPTGNVDPAMAHRLLRLFVELNRLGTTVLIASHDITLVRSLNAPVLELAEGRLVSKPKAA
ncbi:cell division ATP-binding protein FtsE [Alkalicaulis satelles]|uniref:Cell division ATP-binding protein FtsE n=1 Tax=Alkalicaulis satelles TaxID=2609175 RepID=A0A5M6ZIV0_9PROT|nr:cell division ATP-binding protein FtsE [Alkalicaulis satelles]KAA5803945.1 cell division ATP-binding protein FtsE [Alkalicaulis satelles]